LAELACDLARPDGFGSVTCIGTIDHREKVTQVSGQVSRDVAQARYPGARERAAVWCRTPSKPHPRRSL